MHVFNAIAERGSLFDGEIMTKVLEGLPGLAVRQVLVTANNKGPQINVVAWTTMVVMILAVGTRLAIKYNAFRRFGLDDALVAVAMVKILRFSGSKDPTG